MRSYTPDDLTFIGGRYDTHDLTVSEFWTSWQMAIADMPYVVMDILGKGVYIEALDWFDNFDELLPDLLRLNLFGPGGDLIWRRDEDRIFWRYIGHRSPQLPDEMASHDYWKENSVSELLIDGENPRRALLWGQYDSQNKRWHEDRVGQATVTNRLRYPVVDAAPGVRAEVLAWDLLLPHGNTVVATWTYALQVVPQGANGEEE